MTILVIEDNRDTAENIRLYLNHSGFQCDLAHSGSAGLACLEKQDYQLVILDIMLPDLNGYQICKRIRQKSDVPIIMLTAKVQETDLEKGLDVGADDYIRKPYSNKELIARVKAHLRRYLGQHQTIGPFTFFPESFEARIQETKLPLTKTEYIFLQRLVNAPGRVFSREQLSQSLGDEMVTERTVDVHMHHLRKKIQKAGLVEHGIKSVYGLGYKWEKP